MTTEMTTTPGTYALGPGNGTLTIHTGKAGAAAKAAHDLRIEVGTWGATMTLARDPAQTVLELTADSRSLRVLEGTGGMTTLGDDEKAGIGQTIDEEVLKGMTIAFRSTNVTAGDGGRLHVRGELELAGGTKPIDFELIVGDDGHVTGRAALQQTSWGMKPYSALFGTLKVADELAVTIDAQLPAPV